MKRSTARTAAVTGTPSGPFPSGRRPGSAMVHGKHTATGAGVAGTRVACLTVAS
jgi:hypothetical protein